MLNLFTAYRDGDLERFKDLVGDHVDVVNESPITIDGLTYLSVGHRPSLRRFHKSRLRLYGTEQTAGPSYLVQPLSQAEASTESTPPDPRGQANETASGVVRGETT